MAWMKRTQFLSLFSLFCKIIFMSSLISSLPPLFFTLFSAAARVSSVNKLLADFTFVTSSDSLPMERNSANTSRNRTIMQIITTVMDFR